MKWHKEGMLWMTMKSFWKPAWFIGMWDWILVPMFSPTFCLSTHTQAHECIFSPNFAYLKSSHIPRVSCCLQTILVTFQEKLQEKPVKANKRTQVYTSPTQKSHERIMYIIICNSKTASSQRRLIIFQKQAMWMVCTCLRTSTWLQLWHQSQLFSFALKSVLLYFKSSDRIWSTVQWKALLCFKVNWRQLCMPADSGDCSIPQCCIWTPTWEWRGKWSRDNYRESEMRRWKEEGSDRGTGARMDMNFVFKYMCLIMYVSLLLRVTVETERRRQRERGADSLCYTKENLRERWNK